MTKFLLASSALLLASAVPAFAQDAPAPTIADQPTFAGPRAEIFGGWDRVGARLRTDNGTTRDTIRGHQDGGIAGGLVGYDMAIGNRLVAGVFGSYALSTARECEAVGSYSGCLKSGRQIEGGARIGARINPNTLVYAKGAYVNGRVTGDFANGVDQVKFGDNQDGWRAGAGVEYAIAKHAYVKAEYDYTLFKSYDAGDLGLTDTSLRLDRNQVLGGFGIRF
jgi:outer membrane immunogenic protein